MFDYFEPPQAGAEIFVEFFVQVGNGDGPGDNGNNGQPGDQSMGNDAGGPAPLMNNTDAGQ